MCLVITTEVCGLSLQRPAYQISVYSSDSANGNHGPEQANDGLKTSSPYNTATCAQSNVETNPWWIVDLGIELRVTQVTLTNAETWGKRQVVSGRPLNANFSRIWFCKVKGKVLRKSWYSGYKSCNETGKDRVKLLLTAFLYYKVIYEVSISAIIGLGYMNLNDL